MITKTIELFSIRELDEHQKEAAYNEWLKSYYYPWHAENQATLKAFENVFPIRLRGDSVYVKAHGYLNGDQMEELSGQRLATYIWNNFRDQIYKAKQYWICEGRPNTVGVNAKHRDSKIFIIEDGCPLTGWCFDNSILEPVFAFLRRPDSRNFYDLMRDCISTFESSYERDNEDLQTMRAFEEEAAANDWYFDENGNQVTV